MLFIKRLLKNQSDIVSDFLLASSSWTWQESLFNRLFWISTLKNLNDQ